MILIALRTGLRIGELRGLQWADVDLQRGILTVARTDPGRTDIAATSPKSGRTRTIALSPEALACLRTEKLTARRVDADDYVWPSRATKRHGDRTTTARSQGNCLKSLARLVAKAGLQDVGWHAFRHTCASWLVMDGVPLRVVQQILGHESIKQTERYAHLAPNYEFHTVMAKLDGFGCQQAAKAA